MSEELKREGAHVTLEMMGDVIEQRIMQRLAGEFASMFAIELNIRDSGPYQLPDGSQSVILQVALMHRYTNTKILSQEKVIKLAPDPWGKPTLRVAG